MNTKINELILIYYLLIYNKFNYKVDYFNANLNILKFKLKW